jgi:small subunit ribosomal protein S6
MLIITPDYEENEAEALIENVKGIIEGSGNLINVDIWGKRRLAYPIQKRTEGYYVVYVFESEASFIAELNQALRVIETILRHMIVLYEDDVEKLKAAQEEAATPEVSDGDTAENTTESAEDAAVPDENTVKVD